jgi:hypothetical protein
VESSQAVEGRSTEELGRSARDDAVMAEERLNFFRRLRFTRLWPPTMVVQDILDGSAREQRIE